MSIDMGSGVVHCVCVDKANDGQSECKSRVGFKKGYYHKKNKWQQILVMLFQATDGLLKLTDSCWKMSQGTLCVTTYFLLK